MNRGDIPRLRIMLKEIIKDTPHEYQRYALKIAYRKILEKECKRLLNEKMAKNSI